MYTLLAADFCIPNRVRRFGPSGRYRAPLSLPARSFRTGVPIGFCSGGFPPPPVTFPATRPVFQRTASAPSRWFLAGKRQPFLSGWPDALPSGRVRREQAFRLRSRASIASDSVFLRSRIGASPLRSPLPGPVVMPVSNLDYIRSLHPFFRTSSRKHLRFSAFSGPFERPAVDKFFAGLWKNLWKTRQTL